MSLVGFQDVTRDGEERVRDLIGRLSLLEKCSQLRYDAPAIERLGIPAYNWWNEALHGVARNGRGTVFPQAIGMAATWNANLVREVASAISDEARAKHHEAVRQGSRQQYQGLTFWTPNINIFRDPRWGRGQETWGEDPRLTAELGAAFVRGLQGGDPRYLKTAACAKHFAVHSGPEALRHEFDVSPTPRDLWETYLPAFQRLCEEGVESFMGAYNAVYGEPCCGSKFLLSEVLRGRWGFRGHVVSDCWAIRDFHLGHKVTTSPEESAALAIKNGCDLNCGDEFCNALEGAALLGMVTEEDLDRALYRVLSTRFRLGHFDPEETVPYATIPLEVVACEAHRRLAFEAAVQSIVLLQNRRECLPLGGDCRSILVTGPLATSVEAMLGNYSALGGAISTPLEGLAGRIAEGVRLDYRKGCLLDRPRPNPSNWTAFEAVKCDAVICCLGLTPDVENEEGDAIESAHRGDRATIELPESQRTFFLELANAIREAGGRTRLIVVLFGGAAFAIPELVEHADAILHAWYPGEAGGEAVAAVLLGQSGPGGRLPVSFPRSTDCLPPFQDYSMQGRTYRFMAPDDVLFPFGYGLGFTSFTWSEATTEKLENSWGIAWDIQNTGSREGVEVVQCYHFPPASITPRLIAFQRIALAVGEHQSVHFHITDSQLATVQEDGSSLLLTGKHRIHFATHAPWKQATPRAVDLPLVVG
jgi:beta-glucosidase